MDKDTLLARFSVLMTGNPGIESFVTENSDETVIRRLCSLDTEPLSKVQLNQLLGLSGEKGVSDGFFQYYWLNYPSTVYDFTVIPGYGPKFDKHDRINSLDQLIWGIYRLYIDALLFAGNVRTFYRNFAGKYSGEIEAFFRKHV